MIRIGLILPVILIIVALLPVGIPRVRADEPAAPMAQPTEKSAKRVAPPEVAPVTVGPLRIEALPWGRERGFGQNGGYVAAIDVATGKEAWTLKVYDIVYNPRLEEDVQDIFISDMRLHGDGRVEITDEDDRRYLLNVETRTVTPR